MIKLIAYILLITFVNLSYAQSDVSAELRDIANGNTFNPPIDPYNVPVDASENVRPTCPKNSHFKNIFHQ